jgi:hypothetical protein
MIGYRELSAVVGEVLLRTGVVENPGLVVGTVQLSHMVIEILLLHVLGRHFVKCRRHL